MFADEDEDGRGDVPKLGHGPDTRFNLVSRNVLMERRGVLLGSRLRQSAY